MRVQSRIKGRQPLYSGVHPLIEEGIEELAHEFECSKSFVVNTLLAEFLNIKEIEEKFYVNPKKRVLKLRRVK